MLRVAIVWTFITIFLVFSYGNIDEDRLEIPSSIFIIAGVQKAGTTALAAYLAQHPNISFADNKELHFFDKNKNYKKGISTYLKHFHVIPSSILIGEATPAYLPSRAACRRIAEHFPQAKLIVLLRNPLSRAYSEYQMKARRVALQEDFIAKVRYSVDEVYSCIKQHAEDYDAIKACLPVEIATHGRIGKLNKALRQAFEELDDWNQVLQLCFSRYNASSTDYSIDINGRSQLGVDGLAFQPKRCWTYYKDGFERLPELHRAFVEEIESFKNCSGFIVNSTLSALSSISDKLRWMDDAVDRCIQVKPGISSQYFYRSMYAVQLFHCFKSIDPQRVLLIGSERLRTAPLEVIIEVQNFLELPQDVSWLSVDSLDTARLIDETFPTFAKTTSWELNAKYPPLRQEDAAMAQEFFVEQNSLLFELANQSFSSSW